MHCSLVPSNVVLWTVFWFRLLIHSLRRLFSKGQVGILLTSENFLTLSLRCRLGVHLRVVVFNFITHKILRFKPPLYNVYLSIYYFYQTVPLLLSFLKLIKLSGYFSILSRLKPTIVTLTTFSIYTLRYSILKYPGWLLSPLSSYLSTLSLSLPLSLFSSPSSPFTCSKNQVQSSFWWPSQQNKFVIVNERLVDTTHSVIQ